MAITVLHLITELESGGAQSALLRLVAGQDRSRFTPVVLCLYNGDRLVARQIRSLGVEVIDLGMTRKWRLDAFWRLWRQLRRLRPTILHTWMFHANIPGRLLGRLAGVPPVESLDRAAGGSHYLCVAKCGGLCRQGNRLADRSPGGDPEWHRYQSLSPSSGASDQSR
jgi:hypothetical protein